MAGPGSRRHLALVLGLLVAPSFAQSDDADKAKEQPSEQTTERDSELRESDSKEGQKGDAGQAPGQRIEDVSLNLTLSRPGSTSATWTTPKTSSSSTSSLRSSTR